VCDGDRALAFGHPFMWSGRSSMSVHPARAVFVQRDNTLGSYKVANPLGVVGTLDQDRLAGIRARLGDGPATTPVASTVTARDDGTSRTGGTQITVPDLVPDLAAFHLLANVDRVFDSIGEGTADLRWVIEGTRASGAPFTVDVKNKYASRWDIAFESIFDPFEHLWLIQQNDFENARDLVQLALDQERAVTAQFEALARAARDEGDYIGEQFLQWFLSEQVEEVASMSTLLTIMDRAGDNLFYVEDFLAREQVGDGGEGGGAPAAAGGAL
jgi:hypothetical protein